MEADATLRGVRLEVGRLIPQQQPRHGCSSRCNSWCNSRRCSRSRRCPLCACAPPPPPARARERGHVTGRGGAAAMATYVSELEAAKKSLSEALGENVKQ